MHLVNFVGLRLLGSARASARALREKAAGRGGRAGKLRIVL